MMICIASGKGGTGKTTIAANLAYSLSNSALYDCDVEEPNAHIFLNPTITKTEKVTVFNPLINDEKCTKCGYCADICEFNALAKIPNNILFFPDLCMSCEACMDLCPEEAITALEKPVGEVNVGKSADNIDFTNGILEIGIPRSIPVIDAVKEKIDPQKIAILDAPPGTSCPVIETITDSDYCILVTEPTPFGLYDLKIAVEVVRLLKVPFGVIINKYGMVKSTIIEDFCKQEDIEILLKIPFERKIAEAYSKGELLVHIYPDWKDKFQKMYLEVKSKVKK
ncbi:MAG: (4Fe-4S)-binding protein [Asgard group archaeon]|nr:(4Fe-4S)-binding protein [Asgard group archaeon]